MSRIWKWTAVAGVGAAYVVFRALSERLEILHALLTEEAWPTGQTDPVRPQASDAPSATTSMRAAG